MLNDIFIATTAISSFNNAALLNPLFFSAAILAVPLFFMVYFYGRDFVSRFGWNNQNIESKTEFWLTGSLAFWILLFGGNYAVIRDSISLLSLMIAVVLFVSIVFVTNRIKKYGYLSKIHNPKVKWFLFFFLLILAGFSAMPNLWGIILQLSAVLCGMIVGDRFNKNLSDLLVSTIVFGIMTVLLLMQPEYFRFGQLGNLTLVHIFALLLGGFFCVTTLAVGYTNAKAKIYNSAYIKLKWLCRIMSILALILFVLTESVPVFIGLMAVCMVSEMLTIYHSKGMSEHICKQSWALLLITFGIMAICPFISMLGLIYLMFIPNKLDLKDFKELL